MYVANGSGSGAWTTVTGLSITGMIADFVAPIAPTGWLELDGSAISTTTFSALYNVMSIQQTGTRNGTTLITGLSSTTNMRAGYYVFGTGITSGTTIVSVDSSTDLTLSAAATSSGTSTVIVSPWLLATGLITLPDLTTDGKFRRSRKSGVPVGTSQSDQNKAHTHAGTTTGQSANHTHTGTTSSDGAHTHSVSGGTVGGTGSFPGLGASGAVAPLGASSITIVSNGAHTHTFTSNNNNVDHTHNYTTDSNGGSETRPTAMTVLTCVKT